MTLMFWKCAAAGVALLGAVQGALAQSYPSRPVRMLHGFAAGANVDTISRVMATELAKTLGQPVVVEPQPGAGGTIAAGTVARAKPDGYTVLMGTGSHSVAGALYEKLPYDTEKSFSGISTVTFFAFAVTASAAGRYQNINDLINYARANPGKVSYGSSGSGSTNHLAGEVLSSITRTEMLHVPYKGFAPALTALLAGEIDFVVGSASSVLGNVKAGKMRMLAMAAPKRWSGMPDVPTSFEQGLKDYDMSSWAGLMGAGGPAARGHRAAACRHAESAADPGHQGHFRRTGRRAPRQHTRRAERTDLQRVEALDTGCQ